MGMNTTTNETETPFTHGKKHMAAMVGPLSDEALRKVWRLTVRLVDQATGSRKAELLGERLAIQEEALRRGYTHWKLAALWS